MKRSHVVPVVVLSKSIVGASAVAFPDYFATLGWPLALATLFALATATVASTEVVLRAMHESRSRSYDGAVKATLEGSEGGGGGGGRSGSESEGGRGRGRGRGRSGSGSKGGLPSLALELSGTAFSFGLLCVYNIVVADIAVGERVKSGSGSGGGCGGLLCPIPPPAAGTKPPPFFFSRYFFFCSRPRFSFLLNALVLVPLSLRRAARDSKIPSAIGILSLLAWAAATAALCLCAWLGGTLKVPSAVPDWRAIAAGSGSEGGSGGGGVSESWRRGSGAAEAGATAVSPPSPPPLPPPSLFACVVGLAREAGLPTSGLVCQLTAPFIVGGINGVAPREAALIVREAGLLSAFVYAFLGIGANALFGSGSIDANVLSNWQPEALAAAVPWLFGGGGGGGHQTPSSPKRLAAARLLSSFVRLSVAMSLVTMYPLLMFPCRDGALRLWARRLRREEEGENEGGEGTEQRRLLPEEEEGERGERGERGEGEDEGEEPATTTSSPSTSSPSHSYSSFSVCTLLLASAAALAALSSGDSAFDALRLTGATAGAAVSYLLPAAIAFTQRRLGVAAGLAAVGAVMMVTAV